MHQTLRGVLSQAPAYDSRGTPVHDPRRHRVTAVSTLWDTVPTNRMPHVPYRRTSSRRRARCDAAATGKVLQTKIGSGTRKAPLRLRAAEMAAGGESLWATRRTSRR